MLGHLVPDDNFKSCYSISFVHELDETSDFGYTYNVALRRPSWIY